MGCDLQEGVHGCLGREKKCGEWLPHNHIEVELASKPHHPINQPNFQYKVGHDITELEIDSSDLG
jgi:hypothetical protein